MKIVRVACVVIVVIAVGLVVARLLGVELPDPFGGCNQYPGQCGRRE